MHLLFHQGRYERDARPWNTAGTPLERSRRGPAEPLSRNLSGMEFRVLGHTEVTAGDGDVIGVRAGMPRKLLCLLLTRPNSDVSTDRIVDALWDGSAPDSSRNLVQGYVSELRRAIGRERVATTATGYRIMVARDEVDLCRFDELLEAGHLAAALELWRGRPFGEFADERWAQPVVARLEAARLDALEASADLELSGRPRAALATELESLVTDHPYRERLWALLVRALYANGRQADALGAYRRARSLLVEELGVEPGPELVAAERMVLDHDASLAQARPATPLSLPAPVTALIGRERDVAEIDDAMSSGRVVTVVGPGGAGKTRLALEVARRAVGRFPDGVWFADLVPAGGEADIVRALVEALRLAATDHNVLDAVADYLNGRRCLVVLDNCEHVVDSCASLVRTLTARCADVTVLATSREPLRIPGESLVGIGGLDERSAAEVFVRAGRAAGHDGDANAADVARICARLDRLPLALELAAATLGAATLAELDEVLARGRPLPPVEPRRGDPRHRSLSAAIDWSIALLDEVDRRGLFRLSRFASTFERDAGDAVGGADGLTGRLLARSLVAREPNIAGRARYRLLETIRSHAIERIDPANNVASTRAHVDYHVAFANQAAGGVRTAESPMWTARVRAASDDLRRAVETAFATDPVDAAHLVADLYWPWFLDGRLVEMRTWATTCLERPGSVLDARLEARLWWALAAVTTALGDLPGASRAAARQVAVASTADDDELIGLGESLGGLVEWARGDHAAAARHHERAVRFARRGGDMWTRALVGALAARSAAASGDDELAAQRFGQAFADAHETGEPMVIASCLDYQARAALGAGDLDGGRAGAIESLDAYRSVGYQEGIASALALMGTIELVERSLDDAESRFTESLEVCRRLRHRGGIATSLAALGIVAAQRKDRRAAQALLGEAERELGATGATLPTELHQLHVDARAWAAIPSVDGGRVG